MNVPDSYAGKRGKCPRCQATVQIPSSGDLEIDESELLLDEPEDPTDTQAAEAQKSITATGRICPRCSNTVPGDEEHCPKCGANYLLATQAHERKLKEKEGRKTRKKDEKGFPLIRVIAAGVLIAGLTVVTIFVLKGKNGDGKPPAIGRTAAPTSTSTSRTSTAKTSTAGTATSTGVSTETATGPTKSRLALEVEVLIEEIAATDEKTRSKAITQLAAKGRPAVRYIEKSLSDENPRVRKGVLEVLSKILGERADRYTRTAFSDPDPSVRRKAYNLAKKLRKYESITLPLIYDNDSNLAGEVAFDLVLAGNRSAPGRVSKVLEKLGPGEISQKMAVAALTCGLLNGTMGSIEALTSEDLKVRKAAINALKQQYGMDRGYDPAADEDKRPAMVADWRDWWKKRTTFDARMTRMVELNREEERLRRAASTDLYNYQRALWRLLVERWRIVEIGEDAVPGLAVALDRKIRSESDSRRTREALQLLGALGKPSALPLFRTAKNIGHPMQAKAVEALGRLGDTGATYLIKLLSEKLGGMDRTRVLKALGKTRSKSAVPELLKALASEKPRVRFTAFEALARMEESNEAVKYLPDITDFGRPEVRELVVRCACPQTADALIREIEKATAPSKKHFAMTLLGEVGGNAAQKYLRDILRNPVEGRSIVKAVEAAARLGDIILASEALNAADELPPADKEKAYHALLYFEDEAAFKKIYTLATRNDRFACQLLPELAGRGFSKARIAAKHLATKGSGVPLTFGIRAIGFIGDRTTAKKVYRNYFAMKDPPSALTDAFIEMVGRTGYEDAVPFLAENLKQGRRVQPSLTALGRMSNKAAEKLLLDYMLHSRREALEALARKPSSRLVSVFAEVLQDSALPVTERATAAKALGKTGSKEAVRELLATLADPKPELRTAAAAGLGALGDMSAVPFLMTLAMDKETYVRREVMLSLALLRNLVFITDLLDHLDSVNPNDAYDREFRKRAISALSKAYPKAGLKFTPTQYLTLRAPISALKKLRTYFASHEKPKKAELKYADKPLAQTGFTVRRNTAKLPADLAKALKKYAPKKIDRLGPLNPLKAEWKSKEYKLPFKIYGKPVAWGSYVATYIEKPPKKPEKPSIIGRKEEPKPTYELMVYDLEKKAHKIIMELIEAPKAPLHVFDGGLNFFNKIEINKYDKAADALVCEGELRCYDFSTCEIKKTWDAPLVEEPVGGLQVWKSYCAFASSRSIRMLDLKRQEDIALADRIAEESFSLGPLILHGQSLWWTRRYADGKTKAMVLDIRKREKQEFDLAILPEFAASKKAGKSTTTVLNFRKKRIEILNIDSQNVDAVYVSSNSHAIDGRFCYFTSNGALHVLDTDSAETTRIIDGVDSILGVTAQGIITIRGSMLLVISAK